MSDQNALTPERETEPLPKWLMEIERVVHVDAKLRRLLELAKAQHEALDKFAAMAGKRPPDANVGFDIFHAYERARRLWEGK